jgi:hypothetical protein
MGRRRVERRSLDGPGLERRSLGWLGLGRGGLGWLGLVEFSMELTRARPVVKP